jgi:sporulation protein YlmC with PRC-barrel domain
LDPFGYVRVTIIFFREVTMASSRYNPEPRMGMPQQGYGMPVPRRCNDITGMGVINANGEDLGKIENIVVDMLSGRVLYAAIEFGGFLGLGAKLFAIPWDAFQFGPERDRVILNVPKERFENAPGFDKDHWPTMADENFLNNVYGYYGYQPYWRR